MSEDLFDIENEHAAKAYVSNERWGTVRHVLSWVFFSVVFLGGSLIGGDCSGDLDLVEIIHGRP